MRMTRIMVALAFVLAVPMTVVGQQTAALKQGIRIEVTPLRGKAGRGTFGSLTGDTLRFVRDDATGSRVALARGDVRFVRVSAGRSHGRGFLKGALIGTGVGIVSGAILGAASYSQPDFFVQNRRQSAAFGGFLIGLGGLVVGSAYGAVAGTEIWKPVDLDSAAR
jgi:hypothetical protein